MRAKRQNSKAGSYRLSSIFRPAAIVVLIFATISALDARNANFQLCFPSVQWVGFGNPPDITKPVSTDQGWSGAFRYVFGNGTPVPDVVVQGIKDPSTNKLYISVEANNLPDWEQSNSVTLTFDSGNGASNMQRLFILPLKPGILPSDITGKTPGVVYAITYQQDSTVSGPNPHGLWNSPSYTNNVTPGGPIKALSAYTCADESKTPPCPLNGYRWTLGLEIPWTTALPPASTNPPSPVSAITVPVNPTDTFGFYINVIRAVNGLAEQVTWPNNDPQCPAGTQCQSIPGCTDGAACSPFTFINGLGGGTPDPNVWGLSTIGGSSCKGVSIGSQVWDIYTNQGISVYNGVNEPRINTNPLAQNIFYANVHNNTVDGNGVAVPASQVLTTFRIADFGLAATPDWETLPPTGGSTCTVTDPNPTNPKDIGANSSSLFDMGPWCLTGAQITAYSKNTTNHQCVKVQLDSAPAQSLNISTIARAGNVVTVNTTGNNPFVLNQAVTITVPNDTTYNGTFSIAGINSPTQFTYSQTAANSSSTGGTVSVGGTIIVNNIGFQNMNFGFASKFERAAVISAHGYPARPCPTGQPCPTDQLFDLRVATRTDKFRESCGDVGKRPNVTGVTAAGNKTVVGTGETETGAQCSQVTYTVHACRHTGTYLTINNKRVELCDGVGAFGWGVRHDGDVSNWTTDLTGPGLEKRGPNLYRIHVPQNGTTAVTATLEPEYPGEDKLAVFADIGGAFPHGTFGNAFNPGFSLNGGLEYMATSRFSAEGIFGYHHFPAKVGSALNLYQFSANGKVYLTSGGTIRPFVNGGIGGYKFSPGSTQVGGNFGAGILKELNARWGVQASYNLHVVNTPVQATKFSTAQVGIRYVF